MLWITGVLTADCKGIDAGTPVCEVAGIDTIKVMPYRNGDWENIVEVSKSIIRRPAPEECWITASAACLDHPDDMVMAVEDGEVERHPTDPFLCRPTQRFMSRAPVSEAKQVEALQEAKRAVFVQPQH